MAIFVVQARGSDTASLERARFIVQRFSWPAFLFTSVWLIYHRLWLALAGWIVFSAAFVLLLAPSLTVTGSVAFSIVAKALVGLEGPPLRVIKGARRATLVDVIEARDRDEAESNFFHTHLAASADEAPPAAGLSA